MKVKTGELSGAALDWAVFVARYKKLTPDITIIEPSTIGGINLPRSVCLSYVGAYSEKIIWLPSSNWSQCGPLIEKHQIELVWDGVDGVAMWWKAEHQDIADFQMGDTPLIAACRAIVSALLGDEIDVPDELAGGC